MNEELNKKLAEWVGFKQHKYRKPICNHEPRCSYWQSPEGDHWYGELPNFTESLDACMKWLGPKVLRDAKYLIIITQTLVQSRGYIRPVQSGKQYDAVDNHSPALALCLAMEKLIDGGN